MLNLAVAMGAAGGTPRPSRNAPAEMVPGSPPTLLTAHRPPVPKPAQVLLGINNASQANLSVGVQSLTVRDAMCGPMVPGVYYTYDEGECGAQRCPVGDDGGREPSPCPDDDTECVDAAAVNDLPGRTFTRWLIWLLLLVVGLHVPAAVWRSRRKQQLAACLGSAAKGGIGATDEGYDLACNTAAVQSAKSGEGSGREAAGRRLNKV